MGEVLITTGYNFEGYRIVKYLGIVSANLIIKDYLGGLRFDAEENLEKIQDKSIKRLTNKTIALGGNGIIGLQFNQFDMGVRSCFSFIATAVLLGKEKN